MANAAREINMDLGTVQEESEDQDIESRGTEENNKKDKGASSADREGELNEQKNLSRIEQEEAERMRLVEEEKKKKEIEPNAINTGTTKLLKSAWKYLVTSWGLTLLWIDIHVFLGMVFGNKFFCKLGMEWVPDEIKRAQFKEAEKMGKVAGTFEGVGVVGLNLGCLLVILSVLMIIGVMLEVVTNPISALGHIFGYVWDSVKSIIPFVGK